MNIEYISQFYQKEIKQLVDNLPQMPNVVGILASDARPSQTYAKYMQSAFKALRIGFTLHHIQPEDLEVEVDKANNDADVHGIFIFYPVFGDQRDDNLRNLISPEKDIEGLSSYWIEKLYINARYIESGDTDKKAILPCTSLAIVKVLELCMPSWELPLPLEGKTVTVFNRSEVVGRPLAGMLSNDGARVYSFDIHGVKRFSFGQELDADVSRQEALNQSDIVITGVPTRSFDLIQTDEVRPSTVCINFSSVANFSPEVKEKVDIFIPRVGPVTVLMSIRNCLRLFENFHAR